MLVTVASLSFDLYTRVSADTTSARMAVIMADYVSLDAAPSIDQMKALGKFLNDHELGTPANVVYVVTALHKPSGNPAEILWVEDRNLRFPVDPQDPTATTGLAADCPQFSDGSSPPAPQLPNTFTMSDGETLIIVEVCAKLAGVGALSGILAGPIYRHYALPARIPGKTPAAPA